MKYYILLASIALMGYLLGSINSAVILSKTFYGQDIRTQGSGNAGFTNILRNYGKLLGAAVFLCDILKTVLVILIARFVFKDRLAEYCASVGVILGHNYPVFFSFKNRPFLKIPQKHLLIDILRFRFRAGPGIGKTVHHSSVCFHCLLQFRRRALDAIVHGPYLLST